MTKGTIEEDILERAKRKMILEYASELLKNDTLKSTDRAVINQMDTTGAHINGTATPKDKSGEFSKEELSAILKFGAQNMYKTDDSAQSKKLDEMDLDDILTKADAFDTETAAQPGGTSLGGEGFLSQFAEIQDVKNDMNEPLSWDDIIPADERIKLDEEESKALAAEELAATTRKRKAAHQPGAYEGMEGDNEDAGSSRPGSPSSKGGKKSKAIGAPRKSNAQKSLELKGGLRVFVVLASRADLSQNVISVFSSAVSKSGVTFALDTNSSSRRPVWKRRTGSSSPRPARRSLPKLKKPSPRTRVTSRTCRIAENPSRPRYDKRPSCSRTRL